jgi:hypothetical protein
VIRAEKFEVWVDYADAEHDGKVASKPRVMLFSTHDRQRAIETVEQAQVSEAMSRKMAEDFGQPHFDATYSVWRVQTVVTKEEA